MTDIDRIIEWDQEFVDLGIHEEGDLQEWLDGEGVSFTEQGSVVASDSVVYDTELYNVHLMRLNEHAKSKVDVFSTLGLEALTGKIIFKSSNEEIIFWSNIRENLDKLGIKFQNYIFMHE